MNLIIGLGNPGKGYGATRHNAGFMAVDYLASVHGIQIGTRECLSRTGSGQISEALVILAKPGTYMNLSGEAVSRLVRKYRAKPQSITVIHDDLDLKPGQIRLRQGGSSAGHRGIESIINCLGTREFVRLKIGIGRPGRGSSENDIVDYVLGELAPQEKTIIRSVFPRINEAVEVLLTQGLETAMNNYNRFFAPPEGE
ncbi:MAG: aminoacyl-tRNA hydrolase [Dehalococcoidales bacterium]|jgi:PTH1 family peptidyl-tRNA hydrolase|nr:aminoacyl-tRNA hydrolase [Dehalococcoidales bacterium]MDD3264815.1 aminoacyl-tRNA hydrolase [Dehalococcoidales bacterium]MDD4322401.1 aminoacyl-tRNA hydrolase [Dehalococcoidales bacterium]MDD4794113.1 aminoacyl-tRNA hydrolase [Dehalococcoidales bacterium]MDD5121889.1 aminoacyl-tRNA hydrolase [Dehalococcoidales bacterium]